MSMCESGESVFSCVVGRGCLLWPACSLAKTVSFPCFILYSKAKFACYSRYLLASYFSVPVPYDEKDIFFGALVLEGLVCLHRTIQLQLLQHYWSGHRLGLLALEMNRDHSVVFEIAPKYCISDSFVNYEDYSIPSKGFLATIVDKMVVWIKFTQSSLF